MSERAQDDGETAPLVDSAKGDLQKRFCCKVLFVCLFSSAVIGISVGLAVGLTRSGTTPNSLQRAKELMRTNIFIDTHNDLPWAFRDLVRDAVFAGGINLATGGA
jgi:hypothetical protein